MCPTFVDLTCEIQTLNIAQVEIKGMCDAAHEKKYTYRL